MTTSEPDFGPWHAVPAAEVAAALLARIPMADDRVAIIAVDGRSAAGKSTAAERLRAVIPDACIVHTDDVAWWHSFFGWADLLRDGVLEPVRRGELPVRYRPPAWDERGREGAIVVPASCRVLLIEGVGAGRTELSDLLDAVVWVQSHEPEARRRGIERDGGDAAAEAFWDEWDAEEVPFLEGQAPWARADLVVCGTPEATPGGDDADATPTLVVSDRMDDPRTRTDGIDGEAAT